MGIRSINEYIYLIVIANEQLLGLRKKSFLTVFFCIDAL